MGGSRSWTAQAGVSVAAVVAGLAVWWELARRRRRQNNDGTLASKLTVILCTSPTRTNPSTALIEETVGSMRHFAPALAECPCVVVCDGYKVKPENRFRSGQVTEECATKYEEFVRRLRLLAFGKMVRCADRMGFGFALKTALEHVRTPYVIVVQHDRNFVRAVEVERLVRAMEANAGWLKYLGLPTTTTMHHARHVVSKYNIRVEPRALDSESTDQVVPLVQWYDSTHICETRHYREFVYRGDLVKKGGFVEDKLGQRQLADIRDGGMAAHVPYGTFVLDDGLTQPMVSHLDSHDRLAYRKFSFVQRGKHDSDEDLMDRNISLPGQVLPDL